MIENKEAINALITALQNAGLPVRGIDGTPRYTRLLTAREQTDADVIVDAYSAGRFDYLDKRVYPSFGDQLDMMFRAIDANPEMKIIFSEFHNVIKTIKDANPKPE